MFLHRRATMSFCEFFVRQSKSLSRAVMVIIYDAVATTVAGARGENFLGRRSGPDRIYSGRYGFIRTGMGLFGPDQSVYFFAVRSRQQYFTLDRSQTGRYHEKEYIRSTKFLIGPDRIKKITGPTSGPVPSRPVQPVGPCEVRPGGIFPS